jgi:hypothetical protein
MNAWGNVNRDRPIGTSKEAWLPFDNKADDWFRSYDQKTRRTAEDGSALLLERCNRLFRRFAEKNRISIERARELQLGGYRA